MFRQAIGPNVGVADPQDFHVVALTIQAGEHDARVGRAPAHVRGNFRRGKAELGRASVLGIEVFDRDDNVIHARNRRVAGDVGCVFTGRKHADLSLAYPNALLPHIRAKSDKIETAGRRDLGTKKGRSDAPAFLYDP